LESDYGARVPIAWPAGFFARFDPVRIYDGSGRVVAQLGQRVRVGGGLEPAAGLRCMFGHQDAFFVQSGIVVVGGHHALVLVVLAVGLALTLLVVLLARKKMKRGSLLE